MSELNLVIVGAGGRMGRALIESTLNTPGCRLHAALERADSPFLGQDAGLFSGQTTWKEVGNIGKNLFGTNVKGNPIEKNNFGDYAMNALGIAAAVYNLGVAPTKNTVKETDVKFTV